MTDMQTSYPIPNPQRRTIQIRFESGSSDAHIQMKQFPHTSFAAGDILALNSNFIAVLDDLRRVVQAKGVDLTRHPHTYLERLRDEVSVSAYNTILSADAQSYLWQQDQKDPRRPLRITLTSPMEMNLIWDLLYMGEPVGAVDPNLFWGFRYPLGRVFKNTDISDEILLGDGMLVGVHTRLRGSLEEVKQLRATLEQHSNSLKITLFDQALAATSLTADTLMALFYGTNFPYGIIHFACHYNNPADEGIHRAYLSLTVHNQDLEIPLLDLSKYRKYGFPNQPFIFVNACETQSQGHLLQTISLPINLINFRAGSVIATACTMPDNFASEFARVFYQLLFAGTVPSSVVKDIISTAGMGPYVLDNVADILLATRRYFLNKYHNPLGLAYGLYAMAEQTVRIL
jgi:hypothetical protein